MGIYHTTGVSPKVPLVPDAFLSLGVERLKENKLRKSYVLWEENNVVPKFVLLHREWLYWYDEQGNRFRTPEEQAAQVNEFEAMLARYREHFGELAEDE